MAVWTHNKATIARVIDGDTVDVLIDHGFCILSRQRLRLEGIDAPENSTTSGKEVTRYLQSLLPVGLDVVLTTTKPDKYGRYLATITLPGHAITINQHLLDKGLAKRSSY